MQRLLPVFVFLFTCQVCFSQIRIDEKNRKYFIGASYGIGTARWYSNFNSTLYDTSGTAITTGDLKFTAQNPSKLLNFEILAPMTNSLRLGMGIAFEDYYLNKILIQNKTSNNYMLFSESFTVNKMFVQAEFPIKFRGDYAWSLSVNSHLGYFSYSGMKRVNFFGNQLGNRFLLSAGLVADYQLMERMYVFLLPNVEYKFFKTSPKELPTKINHNIINYSISGGLRINLYSL